MEIFCDESGFTGNQLLDNEQQVFAYAAVAIDSTAAHDLVDRVRRKYRLGGEELKGSDLLKRARGLQAVTEILRELQGQFLVAVHLKPYALACKFFEYIFEPAFSECNSIFYGIDFHRYIATLLFVHFRARDVDAAQLLEDFCLFARKGDTKALQAIFPKHGIANYTDNPLAGIGLFAELHRKKITDEVIGPRERDVPNWLLDLTTTSLYNLLVLCGEKYGPLEVVCDEAKPLAGDLPLFNAMVGRKDQAKVKFQGVERSILFNLSKPLRLAKSHDNPGLQLADVVASAASFTWKKLYEGSGISEITPLRDLLFEGVIRDSIWPDLNDMDLDRPKVFANSIVLMELVDRSVKKENLCEGMFDLFQHAIQIHPVFLANTASKRKLAE